jgi:hypothetical protein
LKAYKQISDNIRANSTGKKYKINKAFGLRSHQANTYLTKKGFLKEKTPD